MNIFPRYVSYLSGLKKWTDVMSKCLCLAEYIAQRQISMWMSEADKSRQTVAFFAQILKSILRV